MILIKEEKITLMEKKEALRITTAFALVAGTTTLSGCAEKKPSMGVENPTKGAIIYEAQPKPTVEIPTTPPWLTPTASTEEVKKVTPQSTLAAGEKGVALDLKGGTREVSERGSGLRSPEMMLPATKEYPFGLWDARTVAHSIEAQMERAITEKSFEINGRVFFLDNWSGVLAKTDQALIFANTSLSVIPAEVSPGQYVSVLGIDFWLEGDVVILRLAQANPGHDEIEWWRSTDGFHWQRIK